MRISDWSSDVCSSDLDAALLERELVGLERPIADDSGARRALPRLACDVGKGSRVGVAEEASALPVRRRNECAVDWTPLELDLLRTAESVHVQHRPVGIPDDADRERAEGIVRFAGDRLPYGDRKSGVEG